MKKRKITHLLSFILAGIVTFSNVVPVYAANAKSPPTDENVIVAQDSEDALNIVNKDTKYSFSIISGKTPDTYGNATMIKNDDAYIISYSNIEEYKNAESYYTKEGYQVIESESITADDTAVKKAVPDATSKIDKSVAEVKVEDKNIVQKLLDKDVVVALIDSGVNGSDELFKDRLSTDADETALTDVSGHGTLLAKIILSEATPDTKILPIKAFDDNNTGTALNVYLAIETAIEKKVDFINLSAVGQNENPLIERAVQDAEDAKIPIVVAAGNYNQDVKDYYPASYDYPYVIASSYDGNTLADSSDYGDKVDFVTNGCTEDANNEYAGTSVSAARFSGYLAQCIKNNKTIDDISDSKTIQKIVDDKTYQYKYLDKDIIQKFIADTTVTAKNTPDENSDPKTAKPTETKPSTDNATQPIKTDVNELLNNPKYTDDILKLQNSDSTKTISITLTGVKPGTVIEVFDHLFNQTVERDYDEFRMGCTGVSNSNAVHWTGWGGTDQGGTVTGSYDASSSTFQLSFIEVDCWVDTPYLRVSVPSNMNGYNYGGLVDRPDTQSPGCDASGANDELGGWSGPYAFQRYMGLAFDKKYIDLVWYPWQHTVSFNNMHNTGAPDYSYTKIYGDTNGPLYTPTDPDLTPAYQFTGYTYSSSGCQPGRNNVPGDMNSSNMPQNGSRYCYDSDGGNVIYTAHFVPINYTINYNTHYGDANRC